MVFVRNATSKLHRPNAALTAACIGLTTLLVAGSAAADNPNVAPAVPAPPANPTSAAQIQNIDQVKTAIKAYYGDTVTGTNPDGSTRHDFSPTGAYAKEMGSLEITASLYLAGKLPGKPVQHAPGKKAILLDVDDTTLNTYNYEIASNFVYSPAQNATFVNSASFLAVPGMPALVNAAKAHGYTVFFLTGRPEAQRAATEQNLTNVGYPVVSNQVYLKDLANEPWLASCAFTVPACTTTQYKSLTRQHIESLGYDIVANFGDQFSDLNGGFADKTFKVPNPMYFLP